MSALWTAAEVAAALGIQAPAVWTATGVSIDSRTLAAGDLFVAVKGPRHDGHDHLAAAFAAGAVAALAERASPPDEARVVVVPDTLAALRRLAEAARARAKAKVIALTGSVGKTGTKDMLALALADQGPTHASTGSYNNHIGVPLTLSRLPADAVHAVVEIGMNHEGEIAPLGRMVRPEVAVVTSIEAVHVENFPNDGVAGIARAKAEIFEGAAGGVAVLNRDNAWYEFLADRAKACGVARIVGFGADPKAEARLIDVDAGPTAARVSALVGGRPLTYRLGAPGRHWALNSLAALAAVAALGADPAAAAAALARFVVPKGRGRRHVVEHHGQVFELIDDSYNASPVSMRAAFAVLAAARPGAGGRRIAVLGDMLELGPAAPALHADLAAALIASRIDVVFTCGGLMARLRDALPGPLCGGHAPDADALATIVQAAVRPGDVVVVKGSAGSRMGRVVEALLEHAGDGGRAERRAANG
ncbi:MAG: UDP-N-acetylmuramoyl-tripeptide--D-alanyl-D-alanine ligase [Pseudomonadota bacterium]